MIPVIIISIIISVFLYRNAAQKAEVDFTNYLSQVVFNYVDYIDLSLMNISENATKDAMLIESIEGFRSRDLIITATNNLKSDSLIFGSGIFFDQNMSPFKRDIAYVYSYRNGDSIIEIIVDDNKDDIIYDYIENKPEWWETPSKFHKAGWTKPYYDTLSGSPSMITYFQPFYFDDEFAGVVTIDLSLESLEKWLIKNERILEKNINPTTFLMSDDSIVILSDIPERIGEKIFSSTSIVESRYNVRESINVISKAIERETGMEIISTIDGKSKVIAFFSPLHSTNWSAISVIPFKIINENIKKSTTQIFILISIFNFILIIVVILIARYISKPIIKLSSVSLIIAEGDYTTTINIKSNDEIGILANNFSIMKTKLMERELHLKEANKQLLVLDDAKNQFLKLISHEIRTPLNGIVGSAYFLSDTIDDPELQEFLEMLKESVDRLDSFSKTALEITQMQTVGRELDKTNIDINSIVSKVIDEKQSAANEKNIKVITDLTENIEIIGIEDYFLRTIKELIGNAIKFSNKDIDIKVKTFKEDGKIKFSVTDTGEVIPLEKIAEITKPFGLAKEHYDKHIGLGLAYVQAFLDIHNASIEIKSSEEETVITLIFDGV